MGRYQLLENDEIVAENDDRDLLFLIAISRHLATNMAPLINDGVVEDDGLTIRIKEETT